MIKKKKKKKKKNRQKRQQLRMIAAGPLKSDYQGMASPPSDYRSGNPWENDWHFDNITFNVVLSQKETQGKIHNE